LAVKKEYRNKGIGIILLNEALAFSKKKNKKYLSLWVAKENSPALHLYDKFGFKKTRKMRAGFFERHYGYTYFYFLKKDV
jgi:[ribosomal protein S18]-alanine N-acetyltransferase